jgi:general secretion pathway protein G
MHSELKRRRTHDDGYTLTEMLVVIVIIGLIAAAVTPAVIGQLGRARVKAARLQIDTVAASLESFREDLGRYPLEGEGLAALRTKPANNGAWLGPYVRGANTLIDPWGRPLVYSTHDAGASFAVGTLGADGRVGGDGANQDVQITSAP